MPKIYLKYIYCLFLYGFLCLSVQAQEKYVLNIEVAEQESAVLKRYNFPKEHADSLSAQRAVQNLVSALHSDGYLLAYVVSHTSSSQQVSYKIAIGEKFTWMKLSPGNVENSLLRRSGYKQSQFDEKPFRFNQVARMEKSLLSYAERNGYPFASLKLDSLRIEENQIGASLNLDLGPLILFDSLDIKSDFTLKARFLGNYLGIVQGNPYDQRKIDYLGQRLRNLPYLRLSEASTLTFQNSEATVHLKVEKRPVNQIDGIIGFLPNANRSDGLLITGQVDIDLLNPFGSGKQIGLHWQKLSEETQNLNLQYAHPNVLGSPLNFDFALDFLKQDTLFTKRIFDLKIGYNLGGNSFLNAFSSSEGTDLIGTPKITNNELPVVIDFDLTSYGMGFEWNNFDDPFLISKGTGISLEASTGNKKISRNVGLPTEVYDGVDLKTLQYTFRLNFQNYLRLKNNFVLVNKLSGGLKANDQLFRNDAFRLGGLKSIRGFNENFFFATKYALATLEGRLLFDESSYLLLFSDLAYLRGEFKTSPTSDWALGLGAGLSFTTSSGIFNFIYALGSSQNTGSFNFNQSKIHFGYTTRF
ncbi:outer membrane protein assembly factor BamA [Roseivirga ehrenbergii]|uniref:Uncharacterized protein n=1 Tax=Roseivirga ehrenbergii (strain DSM 102268 / JCM 13514 / KCTC 12282 / NCIMB 14502 / KMM 6017) TaxID=279360 RepID=A0A150XCA2_ROSEK|nr:BamA/TamA family outer membrane protein [Roseivirga ehrenbergii]KYG76353.1 hypothetical protein MB14_03660 [Roseivirga ehrenbergii]TCL00109.1 outer membrane protein assembly factor BamA [Roseivirga ehrenbergii]